VAQKKDWLDRLSDLDALMGSTSHSNEAESCRKAILKLLEKHGKIWRDLPGLLAQARKQQGSGAAPPPPPATMPPSPEGDQITPLDLFKIVRALFRAYVYAQSPHHHTAFALWTMHTYVFDQFRHTPRLLLSSAIEGEGKTTVLDVLDPLVSDAHKLENVTGAALMRLANKVPPPTLLLDEGDNLNLAKAPMFRAILNAGYKRGGRRTITVRGEPVTFSVFAPIAFACISTLPGPLMRRSIVIPMKRATREEIRNLTPLNEQDPQQKEECRIVRMHLLTWGYKCKVSTLNAYPPMPSQLPSSPADAWRPLVAIADACGEGIGKIARDAAIAISGWGENPRVLLLADLRTVFETPVEKLSKSHPVNTVEHLASASIVAELLAVNEMWADWTGENNDQNPRKMTAGIMGKMLRGPPQSPWIKSVTLWPSPRTEDSKSAKGYRRADLEKLWEIYCPHDGAPSDAGTPAQSNVLRYIRRHAGE
jgi:uncharacterized protein DUF3631